MGMFAPIGWAVIGFVALLFGMQGFAALMSVFFGFYGGILVGGYLFDRYQEKQQQIVLAALEKLWDDVRNWHGN